MIRKRRKKNPSIINRAQEALREEFERNPKNPSKRLVRKAGLAFLINTPGSHRSVSTSVDSHLGKLRKVVTRTATIGDGEHWTTIKMDRTSIHKRRPWLPSKLGKLAFRKEPSSGPIEVLSLATAKIKHRAEVSEPSVLPVAKVAAFLLTLPIPKDK